MWRQIHWWNPIVWVWFVSIYTRRNQPASSALPFHMGYGSVIQFQTCVVCVHLALWSSHQLQKIFLSKMIPSLRDWALSQQRVGARTYRCVHLPRPDFCENPLKTADVGTLEEKRDLALSYKHIKPFSSGQKQVKNEDQAFSPSPCPFMGFAHH